MNASTAALLIDLQVDFLDRKVGRMPVGENDASRVIAAAESVLAGRALTGALVLAIVNAFPRNQVFANMVRRYSALAGTPGAAIDPRLRIPTSVPVLSKKHASAFTNPQLRETLDSNGVRRLVLIGVMTEGCVRATAIEGRKLGYEVVVPEDAVATDSRIKAFVGRFLMLRAGTIVVPSLASLG